jgi:hypothetical protein
MSPRIPEVIPDENLHLFVGDEVIAGTDQEVFDPASDVWITNEIANHWIQLGWGVEV